MNFLTVGEVRNFTFSDKLVRKLGYTENIKSFVDFEIKEILEFEKGTLISNESRLVAICPNSACNTQIFSKRQYDVKRVEVLTDVKVQSTILNVNDLLFYAYTYNQESVILPKLLANKILVNAKREYKFKQ